MDHNVVLSGMLYVGACIISMYVLGVPQPTY